MNKRARLFPIMMLALVAGCSPAPGQSAQSDNVVEAPMAVAAPVDNVAMPDPVPPPPARPAPIVTVRAHPAPLHPLDLPPSQDDAPIDPFPAEVTAFMVDRDGCDHFRGEEPYDAERRAFLDENIAELCTGTDAKLAMLRRRYGADQAVMAALGGYEERIEGRPSAAGETP